MIRFSSSTIGWDCPYWLMTLLWLGVLAKYFSAWQFRVSDLVYFSTIVALVAVCIRIRFALPVVVGLNLLTVGLLLLVLVGFLHWFWTNAYPMWPLAVPVDAAEKQKEPGHDCPGSIEAMET